MTDASMEPAAGETSDPAQRVPGAIDDGGGAFASGTADITALAFLVMIEAAESAQSDLQAIMAATKAAQLAKQKLRHSLGQLTRERERLPSPHACAALVDEVQHTIKDQLAALTAAGETESLRLQMAMDRLSRLLSALSNLVKQTSATEQSVTHNPK